jgi:membrane-bound metal-dependent hydrolase YbcI (DUF457 family)
VLPVGHFLVAAIPVVVYVFLRDRELPSRKLAFVVLVGSQFPDLIDKPLAYQFFLIPNGRMFAHSLVIAIPLSIAVLLFVRRTGHTREGLAFGFAYLSHIVADFRRMLLRADPQFSPNVLWPLVPANPVGLEPRWAGPGSINVKLWTAFSAALLLVTVYLVWAELGDGTSSG